MSEEEIVEEIPEEEIPEEEIVEEEEIEVSEPEPEPKPQSRAQQEIIKLRERAQKAEEDIRKAKEELESLKKPVTDDLWEKEEATLKKVDPNSWEAYNINVARSNRANQKAIAELKMQGADREDRHAFEQLRLDKPKIYEAYKDEVEKRYASLLATGHVVPRMMICDNILGEALRTGKLKTKPAPPVKRGETPRARSDIPRQQSPGRNSPEAVAKRLENISI